jgi:hypothetical protein
MRLAPSMAVSLAAGAAGACPCGAALGPVAPWTQAAETVAVASAVSVQVEPGTVDLRGRPWSAPSGVATRRVVLDLAAAWRVLPSVELAAQWSAAYTAFTLPGVSGAEAIPGDLALRARWESAAPLRRVVPQVAAWAALRAPTGGTGAAGLATVTGLGLGAWEPALGAELRWSVSAPVTVLTLTELGLRVAPIGVARPGLRWMLGAAVAHQATARWGWTAALTEIIEGEAVEGGQPAAGSSTRRTLLALGASVRWTDALRTAVTVSGDLPVPGLERNVTTQLRAGVTVVWSR